MMSVSSRQTWLPMLVASLLLTIGCGQPAADAIVTTQPDATQPDATQAETAARSPDAPSSTTASVEAPAAETSTGLRAKIKFKTDNGETAFSLKPQDDGAKLVDAAEKEIARFNLDGNKLKIKDPDDVVLGYVVASEGRFKIKNAQQDTELWELQRQDDGDWKLKDGQEQLICKIKARDYGFEIEDADQQSLFKVKLKDGKTSLRDGAEKTLFSTHDALPTIAVACLGFEAIDKLEFRSALLAFLTIRSGR